MRGCDLSGPFIQLARQFHDIPTDQGYFEDMDYPDCSLDLIASFSVLENIPNQEEFLGVVHSKLKQGGLYYFNFVDMTRNWIEALQKDKYFLYRPPITYGFQQRHIVELLQRNGFSIMEISSDIRCLSVEKILGLLRWKKLLKLAHTLKCDQWNITLPAYPGKLVLAQKN